MLVWELSEGREVMADKAIKIFVSQEVKVFIERAAKQEGRSVSNWCARVLEQGALSELAAASKSSEGRT